jgi:hypothetical protein
MLTKPMTIIFVIFLLIFYVGKIKGRGEWLDSDRISSTENERWTELIPAGRNVFYSKKKINACGIANGLGATSNKISWFATLSSHRLAHVRHDWMQRELYVTCPDFGTKQHVKLIGSRIMEQCRNIAED